MSFRKRFGNNVMMSWRVICDSCQVFSNTSFVSAGLGKALGVVVLDRSPTHSVLLSEAFILWFSVTYRVLVGYFSLYCALKLREGACFGCSTPSTCRLFRFSIDRNKIMLAFAMTALNFAYL